MNTFRIARCAFAMALIMSLVMSLLPVGILASGVAEMLPSESGICGDHVRWSLDAFGTLTISGSGKIWNYDGDEDRPWEPCLTEITEVIIEEGVTAVGSYAFADCIGLTSAKIGESVTCIGEHAFYGCTNLSDVDIPEGVTDIEWWAFAGCSSLTDITIPEGVTNIGGGAFSSCTGLTSVTIPASVICIEQQMFSYCSSLTNVIISEGVTGIRHSAFYKCGSLASVTIPESVTVIASEAFYGCTGLTGVTIPGSVTQIGSAAFEGCSSLTGLTISEGVTSIGWGAFDGCTSLTAVTIPEGVTTIKNWVFRGCTNLTNITIPDSVTLIQDYAFYKCDNLWHVLYTGTEKQWNAINIGTNNSFLANATRHCCVDGNEIPDAVSVKPTCTVDGALITTCTVCGDTYTKTVPSEGHKIENGSCTLCTQPEAVVVSGSITSFGEGAVTLVLTGNGNNQPLKSMITDGLAYTLEVKPGTYILNASKINHVTRQYILTAEKEALALDIKLCLFGDINGDGKVNVADTAKVYSHVKGTDLLTDYAHACGDVDGSGTLNIGDAAKIYGHVKNIKPMW